MLSQYTECVELFRKAAAKHIKLAGEAADGRGVDRHLFGLKKVLKEGEELPALYQDPTFGHSSNWVLSTSQLSSAYFDGWGYGEGAFTPAVLVPISCEHELTRTCPLRFQQSLTRDTASPTRSMTATSASTSRR